MTIGEHYTKIFEYFATHSPEPVTELHYQNSFQLLVAVILSAQCTDKRVNMVTPALFEAFPSPELLKDASFDEVFALIKSISFPNNKSKHLIAMAKTLFEDYQSIVPESIDELQKMQGVGRKTANVISSVVYNKPAMAVDTHVFRVSKRLGLVNSEAKTPLEVERELMQHIPTEIVAKAHHWLILHGRYTCTARKPKCEICGLTKICPSFIK